jgi:hypothetical protein
MGCGCYDSKKERKRVEQLAKIYSEKTGEKVVVFRQVIAGKECWDFHPVKNEDNKQ